MDPDLLRDLKALADVARLRILGRLSTGPATLAALETELRIPRPTLSRDLERLADAGLVSSTPAGWRLRPEGVNAVGRRLNEIGESEAGRARAAEGPDQAVELLTKAGVAVSADDAKVLRSFVSDGRLVSIPAHENKRIVVLRWALETCFAEDRAYPESEVNDRLRELNEDTAALRRYLVESGLMDRQSGVYRRRPLREVRPGV